MLTTRHAAWDERFRLWRQHGMSIPDTVRHGAARVQFERYLVPGYNYRMTDLQAAIGRAPAAPAAGDRGGAAGAGRSLCRACSAAVPGVERAGRAGLGPVELAELLRPAAGQRRSGRGHAGDARCTAWRRGAASCAPISSRPTPTCRCGSRCPKSERARDRCILLPLFAGMTERMQDEVVAALRAAAPRAGRPSVDAAA